MRVSFLLLLCIGLGLAAGCVDRQAHYPSRPVLLVCPWAVGGGTDRLSRQLAAFLEVELDVPVNVVNAPGGAGVTGHSRGAHARPDGYTLTMMTLEINMLHWRDLTEIAWEDYEPVALINRDPAAIFVRADDDRFPDLPALIERAREAPGALTASGTAAGGVWHLALAGLLDEAGLDPASVTWIPMNGAAPALQELAGGGIDMVACSLPEARAFLESGRIRTLGVMADQRLERYPDVPTVRESGFEWSMGTWRGIGVPAGTPGPVVRRLAEALERIVSGRTSLNGQAFPELVAREGLNLEWEPPAEFRQTLRRTDRALGALLTSETFASVTRSRFGPMDFPILVGTALVAVFGAMWVGRRRERPADAGPVSGPPGALMRIAEVLVAVALYGLLAEPLGFVLTMALVLFGLLWRLGSPVRSSLLTTVIAVPLVYTLFSTLLRVPLPRGLFGW